MKEMSMALALNNENGFLCGEVIARKDFSPRLLILHPPETSRCSREIRDLFPEAEVLVWQPGYGKCVSQRLKSLKIERLLSVNFGYIVPEEILSEIPKAFNLHVGYLPWNRGSNPNVWSLVEGTPAGVTLHYMTPVLDGGDIITQQEVSVEPFDTGKSLYLKLQQASVTVMQENFEKLLEEDVPCRSAEGTGTYHRQKEMKDLCELDLDESMPVGQLLDRLRALSFPPYRNAYFVKDGKKIFVDIRLDPEEPQ